MKRVRLTSDVVAWVVGTQKKIQLPKSSVLHVEADALENSIGEIQGPHDYSGTCIKITPEITKVLADVDEDERKAAYSQSIKRCLDTIFDGFETLVRVDSGTPLQEMRDLGPVKDWVKDDKNLKTWLHHVNIKITHPSLSVEKAMFPNNEMHLVLVLTQTW